MLAFAPGIIRAGVLARPYALAALLLSVLVVALWGSIANATRTQSSLRMVVIVVAAGLAMWVDVTAGLAALLLLGVHLAAFAVRRDRSAAFVVRGTSPRGAGLGRSDPRRGARRVAYAALARGSRAHRRGRSYAIHRLPTLVLNTATRRCCTTTARIRVARHSEAPHTVLVADRFLVALVAFAFARDDARIARTRSWRSSSSRSR